jgi:hypothetical protein
MNVPRGCTGRRGVTVVALAAVLLLAPAATAAREHASPARALSGRGAALLAYLNAVNKGRSPYYLVAGPALDTALQKVGSTPDATWVTAAAKAKAAELTTTHLASALEVLTPPAGLEAANQDFLESVVLVTGVLKQLSTALSTKNVAAANAAAGKFPKLRTQVDALEIKWRTAVTAAAKQAGVTVPSWVATLGQS